MIPVVDPSADDKYLYISADGILDIEEALIDIDTLPINENLKVRLNDWLARIEPYSMMPEEDIDMDVLEPLSQEGRALAQEIKNAMPEWEIVYLDEAELIRHVDSLDDRDRFEFVM